MYLIKCFKIKVFNFLVSNSKFEIESLFMEFLIVLHPHPPPPSFKRKISTLRFTFSIACPFCNFFTNCIPKIFKAPPFFILWTFTFSNVTFCIVGLDTCPTLELFLYTPLIEPPLFFFGLYPPPLSLYVSHTPSVAEYTV